MFTISAIRSCSSTERNYAIRETPEQMSAKAEPPVPWDRRELLLPEPRNSSLPPGSRFGSPRVQISWVWIESHGS